MIDNPQFQELSKGIFFKERAISYKGELRYIDLLVEQDNGWVIIDYKSAKGHDEQYHKQVSFYKQAVASITRSPVKGYLVYLLDGQCDIVEV